jgi:hypothetical protein
LWWQQVNSSKIGNIKKNKWVSLEYIFSRWIEIPVRHTGRHWKSCYYVTSDFIIINLRTLYREKSECQRLKGLEEGKEMYSEYRLVPARHRLNPIKREKT